MVLFRRLNPLPIPLPTRPRHAADVDTGSAEPGEVEPGEIEAGEIEAGEVAEAGSSRPAGDPPTELTADDDTPPTIGNGTPQADATPGRAIGENGQEVLARLLIVLLIAAVLSTGRLVSLAEAQPFGPVRDGLVGAAVALDDAAVLLRLDRPARWLDTATGRSSDQPSVGPATLAGPIPTDVDPLGPTRPAPPSDRTDPPTTGEEAAPSPDPLPFPSTSPAGGNESAESDAEAGGPLRLRVITGDEPLRLWAGGDSLGEYVGNQLLHPLTDPELVAVTLDYRISTGLTRPDYFDWPTHLTDVMAGADPPEALVFMVGGNDNQNMLDAEGRLLEAGTAPWAEEYRRRAGSIMDVIDPATGRLFWIGLPPMRDGRRQELSAELNRMVAGAAAARPHVTFIHIDERFAGPDGGYSSHLVGTDGERRLVRAADGVHITFAGSTWVAEDLVVELETTWRYEERTLSGPQPPATGIPEGFPL